jgi:GT2 family glycosyltransferase
MSSQKTSTKRRTTAARRRPPSKATTSVKASLRAAAWLSRDVLLLVGTFDLKPSGKVKASLLADGKRKRLEINLTLFGGTSDKDDADGDRFLMVLHLPGVTEGRHLMGTLVLENGAKRLTLQAEELTAAEVDLQTVLRRELAPLEGEIRTRLSTFLAEATASWRALSSIKLSKSLHVLREGMRERLPVSTVLRDLPRGLTVDSIWSVDDSSFYLSGWMYDEEAEISRLTAVAPEGARAELLPLLVRYPRPDVADFYQTRDVSEGEALGFLCFFDLGIPSYLTEGWVLELEDAEGAIMEITGPPVVTDPKVVREGILNELVRDRLRTMEAELISSHIHPAISRLQRRLQDSVKVETVTQYGEPPEQPEVSVIVPLYGRTDFVEQQLAEFTEDPEIRAADLVYVLDSPELEDPLLNVLPELFEIYRVPFRLAVLERNVGFAGANNAGVSLARGKRLLLLNSDVLPDRPGWLRIMQDFYSSKRKIGALGAKLLYEDGSLQHAGLSFRRPPGSPVWENVHFFKGLHRTLPEANVPRRVPAVTAACMMIDRKLYERFGGLQGMYVQGDYEDSDLCLRLMDEGYEHWYLPEVELYHLEGQSYSSVARQVNGRYNRWLHTKLWNSHIELLMGREELWAPS